MKKLVLAAVVVAGAVAVPSIALARHGADDVKPVSGTTQPASGATQNVRQEDRNLEFGDDRLQRQSAPAANPTSTTTTQPTVTQPAANQSVVSDDPAGDDHGRRGSDDNRSSRSGRDHAEDN
jgi:hypothetical protein